MGKNILNCSAYIVYDNIQYDLHLGAKCKAMGVVLHLGFKNDLESHEAMSNLIHNINKIIKNSSCIMVMCFYC